MREVISQPSKTESPQPWAVVHRHEHGDTVHAVLAIQPPTQEQVIKLLKLDFEPDKGEEINIFRIFINLSSVPLTGKGLPGAGTVKEAASYECDGCGRLMQPICESCAISLVK
jgi:hypothetical protein